jgi:dATP pyrophosphohydrolase
VFLFRAAPALEVLLLERAGGGLVGEWCPVAGRVEAGELPRETAVREVHEETGLSLQHLGEPDTVWAARERDGRRLTIHVFSALVHESTEVELNYEHTAYRWCTPERAHGLLPLAPQRRALKHVLHRGAAFSGTRTRTLGD